MPISSNAARSSNNARPTNRRDRYQSAFIFCPAALRWVVALARKKPYFKWASRHRFGGPRVSNTSVVTFPKPTLDDAFETVALSPKCEAGFLVKIHPFEIHSALIRLEGERFTIGRDPKCKLRVQDGSASRIHASIERRDGHFEIADLQSTNGLYINQNRVAGARLQSGDRIRIGEHIFKFLSAGHVEAEYHETVYSMMTRDGLTGIFNKRFFTDALTREIDRAARTQHELSLALLDIDFFKKINDTHGHLAGDEVLQEFAQRLAQVVPRDATLARLGGEEFGIILAECGLDEAQVISDLARGAIESPAFLTSAGPISVTVSIGLGTLNGSSMPLNDLLIATDALLYKSKSEGRNRVTAQVIR
jgi:two-component system, cell cycle response regulator